MNSEIKLSTGAKAYLANSGGAGVLVLHAWWGLKPFFKEFYGRLANEGFAVLAPDLRNGEIAKTIDEAKALMEKSDGQLISDTVMAAKDYLREKVKNKIGVIGFSMGGAWHWRLYPTRLMKLAQQFFFMAMKALITQK